MWALKNTTPYVAERFVTIDPSGERRWVVAIKGTFDIQPDGSTSPAQTQVPAFFAPEFVGDDAESSVRYEADLRPAKPSTDVYVVGSAFAPGDKALTGLAVGLQMPGRTKSLQVTGDRVWERNAVGLVEPSAPLPFTQMPLVYERSFGGYDRADKDPTAHRLLPENPVGTGKAFDDGVAGFGAIASHWQPRISFQGTYDVKWLEEQKPLLPLDWDPQVLMCAPADQQFRPHLRGGEAFAVVNMCPSTPVVRFTVPKHYFGLKTIAGAKTFEHRARIDTVVIEPEHPRVTVVWHSELDCHHDIDAIDHTIILEKRYV
jgi:hypothetical protein